MIYHFYRFVAKRKHVNDEYVGYTSNTPEHRFLVHQNRSRNRTDPKYNLPIYKIMRQHGGIKQFDYIVEQHDFDTKVQALAYEKKMIKQYRPSMNTLK